MIQQPDKPLTPVELFRRGIEITQQIRGRIEEARAYYLGRSSREPAHPLSEIFERMTDKRRSAGLQPDAQPTNRRFNHHQTASTSKPSPPFRISPTNRGKSHQQKSI